MDVTVAIATFGDWSWHELAKARAVASANALGLESKHVHGRTLHDARNWALEEVSSEWVIFLDADDELGAHYVERMAEVDADVRVPLVSYIAQNGQACRPYMPRVAGHIHDCTAECLPLGNYVVIGACVRTELLVAAGGWQDWPIYEDWATWLKVYQQGATFAPSRAVYRAHSRPDSRNRAPDREFKHATHQAIARAHGVPVPA